MPNNQVHTNTEAPQLHQSDWFADHLLLLFWCINMLEIQRIALKQFLTISLTVHGKFLDSCFCSKARSKGRDIMSALPEWSRNGTRKLALTCTGTLLPYTGSFYFVNKFIGPYICGENTVRVLMLVASYWRTYQHVVHTSLIFICLFQDAWSPL